MSQSPHPRGIRGWLVAAAALVCLLVTARLGWWQLDRADQKQALQTAVQAQAAAQPWDNAAWRVALQATDHVDAAAQAGAALLHHPVLLRGRWLAQQQVFLDNRQMQGRPGFFVITPLLLEGGGAVAVQRGWVPRNFQDRTLLPAITTPTGPVVVQGRVAPPPSALYQLGSDAPEAGPAQIRQNLDLAAYALTTGLDLPPWSVLQTDAAADGLLRDWPQPDSGVAKHYGYAAQWFGLSALVALLYFWFQILRPRRRTHEHAHDPVS
ncbi:SURF1 family protein [Comamonas sp. GB3 AK4-5]|uniref:SURF1 family protein n=1 Tax=Comamonas sp. GB3 AK4-5 TaxID=3231487 RepID=UPI00351EA46A